MKKRKCDGIIIVIIFFIFISGCITTAGFKEVSGFKESISQSEAKYKIAYTDDSMPVWGSINGWNIDPNRRINICISDLYFKDKIVLHPAEIYNWYLFPRWSPDGRKLAFVGVTCRLLEKQKLVYDVGVFIADENGKNIKEVFSSKDILIPHFYIFYDDLVWSKNGSKLLFPAPQALDKYSKYRIISSEDLTVLKESMYGSRGQSDFQYDRPFAKVSPDGEWEILVSLRKEFPLNPKDYYDAVFHPMEGILGPRSPSLTLGSDATYIKSSKGFGKRKIWPHGVQTQWTPDSKYIVGYTYPLTNSDKCFIANLKGELMIFKGFCPNVQYRNIRNETKAKE